MADEVALSAAVRNSLLSLQDTSKLIARTESRLSTGLRVSSAVDDAVSFFQAKALSDRAFDFQQRKDDIDQGISTVNTALNAVEAIETLTQQMKGLTHSLRSATGDLFNDLVEQFNEIRSQISTLAADATYQGVNLVNGTGITLEVEFSEKSNSLLVVDSVDLTNDGLNIDEVVAAVTGDSGAEFNFGTADSAGLVADASALAAASQLDLLRLTYNGPDDTFVSGSYELVNGSQTFTLHVTTVAGGAFSVTKGDVVDFAVGLRVDRMDNISTASVVSTSDQVRVVIGTAGPALDTTVSGVSTYVDATNDDRDYIIEEDTASIKLVAAGLDDALTKLRANAATLGSNVALLKTRLDFTTDYVNTLEGGAGKLTLSDINEEGANLLALQTRQQLGISALAFAGQAEQSILALFN